MGERGTGEEENRGQSVRSMPCRNRHWWPSYTHGPTAQEMPLGLKSCSPEPPALPCLSGDGAFYGCRDLAGVLVPNGVTSIGNMAFAGPFASFARTSLSECGTLVLAAASSRCRLPGNISSRKEASSRDVCALRPLDHRQGAAGVLILVQVRI